MTIQLKDLMNATLDTLRKQSVVPNEAVATIHIVPKTGQKPGSYECDVALGLAEATGIAPQQLAQQLIAAMPKSAWVDKIDCDNRGVVSLYLCDKSLSSVVGQILALGEDFGRSTSGAGTRVLLELVSASPVGPLHVGHGRCAAYGAALGNLLAFTGYNVHREYYVNDAGRQMNILAASVWLRYLELCGEAVNFPKSGYKGDYVWDVAADVHRDYSEKYRTPPTQIFNGLPPDATPDGLGDKEAHIDALVDRAKELLGSGFKIMLNAASGAIVGNIKKDLSEFGVQIDQWYSERSLVESNAVTRAIQSLKKAGHAYEKDGNLWFAASAFDGGKDRIIARNNGATTYLASYIAYHYTKLERGFDQLINVWETEHHDDVKQIDAVMLATGSGKAELKVLMCQPPVLHRGREKVKTPGRVGALQSLRQLRRDVGNDSARFFFVQQKCDQAMDFDLEWAKSQGNDNPLYCVQQAYARICEVFLQLQGQEGADYDPADALDKLERLTDKHEQALLSGLACYCDRVEAAASRCEPEQISRYLRELADNFHSYYNAQPSLSDTGDLRAARLALLAATRHVLGSGLAILGVSAPNRIKKDVKPR